VGTDFGDVGLVNGLKVFAADRHHFEVGDKFSPATVWFADSKTRLELDHVSVIAVGHVQSDVAAVGLDGDGL
jgi:hypothetical protein